METLETLLAQKYNVYLQPGNASIPAVQLGSYLTKSDAINTVRDWTPRICGGTTVCVYVNESGNTRGGELVAIYRPGSFHEAKPALARAPVLGWDY